MQAWRNVPTGTLLQDLIGPPIERLSGTFEVVHGRRKITDLSTALSDFGGVTSLAFGIVRTHPEKVKRVLFTPYVSLDGASAARFDEMSCSVPFPQGKHEKVQHILDCMEETLMADDATGFKGKFMRLLREDLPARVRNRKVLRFIRNGEIACVFLFDNCDCRLRMEIGRFAIRTGENERQEARLAVDMIKQMRDAEYEI